MRIIITQHTPTANPETTRFTIADGDTSTTAIQASAFASSDHEAARESFAYLVSLTALADNSQIDLDQITPDDDTPVTIKRIATYLGELDGIDLVASTPTVAILDLPDITPDVFWATWTSNVNQIKARYTEATGMPWPVEGAETAFVDFMAWCQLNRKNPIKTMCEDMDDMPVITVTHSAVGSEVTITGAPIGNITPAEPELIGFLGNLLSNLDD